MPRPPARLANCYVPLHLESSVSKLRSGGEDLVQLRTHRNAGELRQLCLETSVVTTQALGSSLIELGHTKILCQVTLNASNPDSVQEEGILECKVKFAPHIGIEASTQLARTVTPLESTISFGKLNAEVTSKEANLSAELHSALISAVQLDKFPKCAIQIHATILQDDGSVLSACISGASLALMDARVEMLDLITSCTVAVVVDDSELASGDEQERKEPIFLADPTEREAMNASALICLAMAPNLKEVTLWSQSGRLESQLANQAIEMCRQGCRTMHKFIREALV